MEYVIFTVSIVLLMLAFAAKGAWDARKDKKHFIRHLKEDYGTIPQKEYKLERYARIGGYYQMHEQEGQLDDITWSDLNMDEIFKRINFTFSASGEEYLYYTLRTPKMYREEFAHLEEVISYFAEHADQRVDVQLLTHRLGYTGNYSLYDYLNFLTALGKRSNLKHILFDLAYIPLIIFCFFNVSYGLMGIVLLMIYNITTYFREKKEIEPYLTSFSYVMRLLTISEKLVKTDTPICEEHWKVIRSHRAKLERMKSFSSWGISKAVMTGGSPLDILIDYVRMTFHVDLMMFNKMLAELNSHLEDIDIINGQIGYIETAIAIGAFRKSLEQGYCLPEFTTEEGIYMQEGYHPLIKEPVKNSITTKRGVLLTGSNASGKSTFLKTVALEAVLAQTIHTCMAEVYKAQPFYIYSSMSLRDDLESGESYYMVEIKSLKRILDAAQIHKSKVLCFVDEVLRGTNTVERIAASTQVLKSLAGNNMCCFAATHDIELTSLLNDYYDNYHFEEEIRDGDIFFNYTLLDGKATTRNAIMLLEIMGYSPSIIEQARQQAEHFVASGIWIS